MSRDKNRYLRVCLVPDLLLYYLPVVVQSWTLVSSFLPMINNLLRFNKEAFPSQNGTNKIKTNLFTLFEHNLLIFLPLLKYILSLYDTPRLMSNMYAS